MDMVGTASMVFDISFFLGVDVAERTSETLPSNAALRHLARDRNPKWLRPTLPDQDTAQSRVMLLRASRAARVGARGFSAFKGHWTH